MLTTHSSGGGGGGGSAMMNPHPLEILIKTNIH